MTTDQNRSGHEILTHVSARLTGQERAQLDALAAATDRTTSAVVRRALRIYINHFAEAERLLSRDRTPADEETVVA
jgi:hypothetical protein